MKTTLKVVQVLTSLKVIQALKTHNIDKVSKQVLILTCKTTPTEL